MFYECVLVIRPDISDKQVGIIAQTIKELVEKEGGSVEGGEYWGFRTLAYRVHKRGKAHYICLGLKLPSLKALQHHLKFHRDLLRFLILKKPKGLEFPTPLFHSALGELGNTENIKEQGEAV